MKRTPLVLLMVGATGIIEYQAGAAGRREFHEGFSARRVRQRYLAILAVGLVHVAVLWALLQGVRPAAPIHTGSVSDLQVRLLSPNLAPHEALAPPLDWTFDAPTAVLVPPPQIVIAPGRGTEEGLVGSPITQKLGPRLDPGHLNGRPELPHTMGSLVAALSLELRILVLPDGTVGNEEIVRSSGEADIDRLAMETVRNSWRYLPASINGKPIAEWTTVIVRFSPF